MQDSTNFDDNQVNDDFALSASDFFDSGDTVKPVVEAVVPPKPSRPDFIDDGYSTNKAIASATPENPAVSTPSEPPQDDLVPIKVNKPNELTAVVPTESQEPIVQSEQDTQIGKDLLAEDRTVEADPSPKTDSSEPQGHEPKQKEEKHVSHELIPPVGPSYVKKMDQPPQPPVGAPSNSDAKVRWPLFAGLAVLVLAFIGIGGYYAYNNYGQTDQGLVVEEPIATPTPVPTATPIPEEIVEPEPVPTATATPKPRPKTTATPKPVATPTPAPSPIAEAPAPIIPPPPPPVD